MSNDFASTGASNRLEVESAKQYKKNNKQNDDTLESGNVPNDLPMASSTLKNKNKPNKKNQEPPSVMVNESVLSRNYVPKIPICPGKYTPMLYTFRVPSHDSKPLCVARAQRPPFPLLLDNAIAVVWCLFAKNPTPKPLGIVQLQWALSFLQTIVNRRGEYPKDVSVCINTILEQLIQMYADLVNELQAKPEKDEQKQKKGETDETNQTTPAKPKKNVTLNDPSMERVYSNKPFSLNYSDIVNASQKSMTNYNIDATKSGKSINQTQSRDELTSFLQTWKQEQIDKIQAELQRLHSIENFIGNCDKNNTQPYLGDKELQVLLAEKNMRNTM